MVYLDAAAADGIIIHLLLLTFSIVDYLKVTSMHIFVFVIC
jgi:hypothetical protein